MFRYALDYLCLSVCVCERERERERKREREREQHIVARNSFDHYIVGFSVAEGHG